MMRKEYPIPVRYTDSVDGKDGGASGKPKSFSRRMINGNHDKTKRSYSSRSYLSRSECSGNSATASMSTFDVKECLTPVRCNISVTLSEESTRSNTSDEASCSDVVPYLPKPATSLYEKRSFTDKNYNRKVKFFEEVDADEDSRYSDSSDLDSSFHETVIPRSDIPSSYENNQNLTRESYPHKHSRFTNEYQRNMSSVGTDPYIKNSREAYCSAGEVSILSSVADTNDLDLMREIEKSKIDEQAHRKERKYYIECVANKLYITNLQTKNRETERHRQKQKKYEPCSRSRQKYRSSTRQSTAPTYNEYRHAFPESEQFRSSFGQSIASTYDDCGPSYPESERHHTSTRQGTAPTYDDCGPSYPDSNRYHPSTRQTTAPTYYDYEPSYPESERHHTSTGQGTAPTYDDCGPSYPESDIYHSSNRKTSPPTYYDDESTYTESDSEMSTEDDKIDDEFGGGFDDKFFLNSQQHIIHEESVTEDHFYTNQNFTPDEGANDSGKFSAKFSRVTSSKTTLSISSSSTISSLSLTVKGDKRTNKKNKERINLPKLEEEEDVPTLGRWQKTALALERTAKTEQTPFFGDCYYRDSSKDDDVMGKKSRKSSVDKVIDSGKWVKNRSYDGPGKLLHRMQKLLSKIFKGKKKSNLHSATLGPNISERPSVFSFPNSWWLGRNTLENSYGELQELDLQSLDSFCENNPSSLNLADQTPNHEENKESITKEFPLESSLAKAESSDRQESSHLTDTKEKENEKSSYKKSLEQVLKKKKKASSKSDKKSKESKENTVDEENQVPFVYPKATNSNSTYPIEAADRPSVVLKHHLKKMGICMNSMMPILEGSENSLRTSSNSSLRKSSNTSLLSSKSSKGGSNKSFTKKASLKKVSSVDE